MDATNRPPQRGGNYEKIASDWRARFTAWDHAAMMRNVGLNGCFDDHLEIPYYGRRYDIDRSTGAIRDPLNPGGEVPFSVQMALLHLLFYAKENPRNSGVWVPFRDVPGASPFAPAFRRQILEPFAERFRAHADDMRRIGVRLGFHPLAQSDAGFLAYAFPCVPVQILFWDADDEFPPQANVLFDRNVADFTHVETVVTIASDGLGLLLREWGAPESE